MREIFALAAGIIIVVSMGFVVAGGLSKKDCKQCVEVREIQCKKDCKQCVEVREIQ